MTQQTKKPALTCWQLSRGLTFTTMAVLATSLGGCGSSDATSTTGVTLSGTVATASSRYSASYLNDADVIDSISPVAASSISDVASIYCVTFAMPPSAGTGTVASNAFSVTIADATGKKLGCFFLSSSSSVLATMVFKGSTEADSKSFSSSAIGLGPVALNLTTGEAVVTESNITGTVDSSTVASASAAFDMTGTWTFGAIPAADKTEADTGSKASDPCAAGTAQGSCKGPMVGMTTFFKRAAGTKSDGSPGFGMMMWKAESDYTACGSTLGGTYASILANNGVDFTNSGINQGDFTYASSATVNSVTYTLGGTGGWWITGATASHPYDNCVQGTAGYTCTDGANKTRVEKGGGCVVTSTGVPTQPSDWSGISSCSQSAADADGFVTQTCTGTASSVAVTCTNVYKQDVGFDFNTSHLIAQNAACTTAPANAAGDLAKAKCFADFYQSKINDNAPGCLRQIQADWTATTAASLVTISDTPTSMMFRGMLQYDSTGTVATMYSNEYENRGAQAGASSYVPCRIKKVSSLVLMKISDTKIKGYYKGISTYAPANASDSKAACVAAYGSGQVEKYLFYLTK